MSTLNPSTIYDDNEWYVDVADPSVGIFGDEWIHLTCPSDDRGEDGCVIDSRLSKSDRPYYATETFTLTCLDCGTSTEFTDLAYMGPDEFDTIEHMREDQGF